MSKYSHEFKLEVVTYYLENHFGVVYTAKQFGIPSDSLVDKWVKKYKEHGISGLMRNQKQYDGSFKQNVVEYIHTNHL